MMQTEICQENCSEVDALMRKMCIPHQEERKEAPFTLTHKGLCKAGNTSRTCCTDMGHSSGEQDCSAKIVTHLQNILGVDLAGCFFVETNLRQKDVVVKLFFKQSTLGIGINNNVSKAFNDALQKGILPALKSLQMELDSAINKLSPAGV